MLILQNITPDYFLTPMVEMIKALRAYMTGGFRNCLAYDKVYKLNALLAEEKKNLKIAHDKASFHAGYMYRN